MNALDNVFFIGLPYVALIVFLIGSIYRYMEKGFKVSSLSSQFLEGRQLFWGSVPFHWGLLVVFLGHLTAFLLPKVILGWNSSPVRLILLEVTGFIFAIGILIGLINLIIRRISNPRLMIVSNTMDFVIEILLLLQVIMGLWIAYNFRWGSSWFAATLTPYLWSIFKLNPDITAVSALPWVIKMHIATAYLIILLIPFSRLVHFLVAPLHYIPRPYQQVIWNWKRKDVRNSNEVWSLKRPQNN